MMESTMKGPGDSGFSRREFLRGSGAVAAASAIHSQVAAADKEGPAAGPAVIRGATTITLQVNGESRKVTVEPRTTLLEVLRTQLDLTGAKPISADGSSGGSTVMVDGKPMAASTLLAVAVVGKQIRTVESLGGAQPDAVVKAFVEHDALQCGFCTPGFVMAVRAFLDKHPQATEADIRGGLNGNLCRCGTYANIIQAAIAVVKGGK
ncbi:MAG: (2Fe-2S)-binding protein [Pirellulales bacterium]